MKEQTVIMKEQTFDSYIRSGMHSVSGYLLPVDAEIIASLLGFQKQRGIGGHLCEIGVHHGRLFLLLALARKQGERALAIDLFEDDDINAPSELHKGRNRALMVNARRLNIPLSDEEIFKTSSLEIGAQDILARIGSEPIRFFSVDGGHYYKHVENDLRLVQQTISQDGIVAVDDFFNPGWPEVTFAAYDFMRATQDLVPFLLSSGKLYLCAPKMATAYQQAVIQANSDAQKSTVRICGHNVYFVRHGYYRRFMDLVGDTARKKWRSVIGSGKS